MRIAALSDFHIGASDRVDCFRHDTTSFLRFLDRLEDEHDRIVLLGDIFQAEHGWGIGARSEARELDRARRRVPQLWRRLSSAPYEYLHGNHDFVAATELGARETLRLEADGFAVFFVHGHQYDPLFRTIYPLARLSTWFSGRVRRAGLRPVSDWLEHHDIAIKHERFKGPGGPYAIAADALMRQEAADAVIMGHTHVPQRLELDHGVFANTGTCSLAQRMYVTIDTGARSVELHPAVG